MPDGLLMPSHLIVLALIALVVFGPKRLPELGRSLGSSIREFRGGLTEAASVDQAVVPTAQELDRRAPVDGVVKAG